MTRRETLTAYKCKITYLLRNNPLFKEQKKAIKAKENPSYTMSDFVADYQKYTEQVAIGGNTDRAIMLTDDKWDSKKIADGVTRWHLRPSAGKQGRPVTVMKTNTQKRYDFGSDTAALYEHQVFIYENADSIIVIFHRQNGSGCKSVFLETANKMLRQKGLKLEMDLCMPLSDDIQTVTPTKITLMYTRTSLSSDIADNMSGGKKRTEVVQDLGLNLEVDDNNKVFRILRNLQTGKIKSNTAFAQIKAECSDSCNYNDAEIQVRFGETHKRVKWNDFENALGSHDITEKLHKAYAKTKDFSGELEKLADEYFHLISETEGGNDVN